MGTMLMAPPAVERRGEEQAGEGAWRREARALVASAARREVFVCDEMLRYFDVRDLQALRRHVEHASGRHAATRVRELIARGAR
ncbi:MAG: hypothetical protein ACHQ4H_03110 [Ktedonobacterales bacterium]